MVEEHSNSSLKQADVWWIVITVIVITLFNIFALIVIFWEPLCAKIVATGIEYGAKQLLTQIK